MKKIGIFLFLMTTLILFTGCPGDSGIGFYGYEPSSKKLNYKMGQTVSFKVSVADQYKNGNYYFKIVDPNGEDGVFIREPSDYRAELKKTVPACVVAKYGEEVEISIAAATFYPGDQIYFSLELYDNSECSGKPVKTQNTDVFTVVDTTPISVNQAQIINKIGGSEHYCNVDYNGNFAVTTTKNLFVDVAYSQVDYYFKSTSKNLSMCNSNNGYATWDKTTGEYLNLPAYTKYGNSTRLSDISLDFVKWVARKSNVNVNQAFTKVDEFIKWAKNNNRYYTNAKEIHDGDLVIEPMTNLNWINSVQQKGNMLSIVYLGKGWVDGHGEEISYRKIGLIEHDNGGISIGTSYLLGLDLKSPKVVGYISMKGIAY